MESRAIAVHENHCSGKVEETGRQNAQAWSREERIARQQARRVEVVAATRQHHHSEQRHGRHPRQAYHCDAALRQITHLHTPIVKCSGLLTNIGIQASNFLIVVSLFLYDRDLKTEQRSFVPTGLYLNKD